MKNNKAFTMIELIIVMGIIGILSGIAMMGLNNITTQYKISKVKSDLLTIKLAAEKYLAIYNTFPVKSGLEDDFDNMPLDTGNDVNLSILRTSGMLPAIYSPYTIGNRKSPYVFACNGKRYFIGLAAKNDIHTYGRLPFDSPYQLIVYVNTQSSYLYGITNCDESLVGVVSDDNNTWSFTPPLPKGNSNWL